MGAPRALPTVMYSMSPGEEKSPESFLRDIHRVSSGASESMPVEPATLVQVVYVVAPDTQRKGLWMGLPRVNLTRRL